MGEILKCDFCKAILRVEFDKSGDYWFVCPNGVDPPHTLDLILKENVALDGSKELYLREEKC